jgi:hypothetical protein
MLLNIHADIIDSTKIIANFAGIPINGLFKRSILKDLKEMPNTSKNPTCIK